MKKSKHVLVVTAEYVPNVTSGVNRVKFAVRALLQQGCAVTVLTAKPGLYTMSSTSDADYQGAEAIVRTGWLNFSIRRILSTRYFPVYNILSVPDKFFHWRRGAIRAGLKVDKQRRIDRIFTSYPGYTNLAVATTLASRLQVPLTLDFRDPPTLNESCNTRLERTKVKVVNGSFSFATNFTAATESTANFISTQFSVVRKDITVVSNGFDKKLVSQTTSQDRRCSNKTFTVIHIGSYYLKGRDIRLIMASMERVSKQLPIGPYSQLALKLVGEVPLPEARAYAKERLRNLEVIVEPHCSNAEALDKAYQEDALLLLQGPPFDAQIPAKAYEYLALNRPIWAVISRTGETYSLLKQHPKNVVFAEYDDDQAIDDSILSLLTHQATKQDFNFLSREFLSDRFVAPILSK